MAIFINQGRNSNPLGPIFGLIMMVLFFILLFYIARGIFTILTWLAPVMLIITLILDYKVVTGYLKWVWKKLQTDTLFGLVMVLVTIFGFPIVSGYLLFKAYMKKQLKDRVQQRDNAEYAEYEIIEPEEETIELRELEEPLKDSRSNDYDNYFN